MFLEIYIYIWYWRDISAISSCKFCIFWNMFCILSCCSWVLFKKEHVQIEHALLQKIVSLRLKLDLFQASSIFCLKSAALLKRNNTLAGKQYILCMKTQLSIEKCTSWKDGCILNKFFFEKFMHLENNPAFCSELCTVPLWKCKNTSTCLKDLLHALHNYCPFQRR